MPKEQPKLSECELYLDHTPVWAGDGFFCSKCMLRFEAIFPKSILHEESAGKRLSEMFGYQGLIMEGNIQKSAEKKIGVNYFPEENPKISDEWAEKKTEESWAERFSTLERRIWGTTKKAVQDVDEEIRDFIRKEIANAEARGRKMPIDKKEWEAAYRADVEEEGRNARRQTVLEIRNIVENLDVSGGGSGRRIRLQLLAYLEVEGNKEINK